ncbi:hypothetical protein V1511DRAFT_511524 [Dipodascopsis uninucleata]
MPPSRMPKKAQQVSKQSKKKQLKKFNPETEDEFLFVGSSEEEHGDRWMTGDPDKAHRFYQRALECYDICLQRYPNSFDAAYNKCRLEFHIYQLFYNRTLLSSSTAGTDHPSTTTAKRKDKTDILTKILTDHEHAAQLVSKLPGGQVGSDLIFNAAQVKLSIAEEQYSREIYLEAYNLFNRAWDIQIEELGKLEMELTDSLVVESADSSNNVIENTTDSKMNDEEGSKENESGEYATLIEPTTYTSLLETATAQLTCLIPIYTISMSFLQPEVCADKKLIELGMTAMQRIAALFELSESLDIDESDLNDTALIVTRYIAVSGYPFDLSSYNQSPVGNIDRLNAVWSPGLDLKFLDFAIEISVPESLLSKDIQLTNPTIRSIIEHLSITSKERHLAQADMLTQFGLLTASSSPENAWKALSFAGKALSSALECLLRPPKSIPQMVIGSDSLPTNKLAQMQIWISRGDTEVLRSNLAPLYEPAERNYNILRKNGETYYRNAAKIGRSMSTIDPEIRDAIIEAEVKCGIIAKNGNDVVRKGGSTRWREILAEAIEDGLFTESEINSVVEEGVTELS